MTTTTTRRRRIPKRGEGGETRPRPWSGSWTWRRRSPAGLARLPDPGPLPPSWAGPWPWRDVPRSGSEPCAAPSLACAPPGSGEGRRRRRREEETTGTVRQPPPGMPWTWRGRSSSPASPTGPSPSAWLPWGPRDRCSWRAAAEEVPPRSPRSLRPMPTPIPSLLPSCCAWRTIPAPPAGRRQSGPAPSPRPRPLPSWSGSGTCATWSGPRRWGRWLEGQERQEQERREAPPSPPPPPPPASPPSPRTRGWTSCAPASRDGAPGPGQRPSGSFAGPG